MKVTHMLENRATGQEREQGRRWCAADKVDTRVQFLCVDVSLWVGFTQFTHHKHDKIFERAFLFPERVERLEIRYMDGHAVIELCSDLLFQHGEHKAAIR